MKKRSTSIILMLILIIFSSSVLAAERVSLGFIYGASDGINLVDRTNGAINQVSPTCLDLSQKGDLVVTKDLTHTFVQAMKEREILVTPFLSNHWVRSKGIAAIKNTENLTNQIVNVVLEYDLDGINVDIENLTPDDKESFSEFVRVLREKLPKEKLLSVCVAANPTGTEAGWQGSYDYQKLGEYANYLFIMAYDEHGQGGACGPVASNEFVENSIKYALEQVSKDKIVLGIPLYGRYWKNGADVGGEAVAIGAVPTLISRNKGIVKYDETIGEACVEFTINNPDIRSKINGVALEDGDYTMWYQNEESIKFKLNLVNQYDLLGSGVWALGQEKVEVWNYYKNELNKTPYISTEEERNIEIREKFEAMLAYLADLEEPDLFPLKNEMNKTSKIIAKLKEENIEKVELPHIENEIENQVKYIKTIDSLKIKNKKLKRALNQVLEFKNIHHYRLCGKNGK